MSEYQSGMLLSFFFVAGMIFTLWFIGIINEDSSTILAFMLGGGSVSATATGIVYGFTGIKSE